MQGQECESARYFVKTDDDSPLTIITILPTEKREGKEAVNKAKKKPIKVKNENKTLLPDTDINLSYEMSGRRNKLLNYKGNRFIKNNEHGPNIYWKCTKWHGGCKARAITSIFDSSACILKNVHNHDEERSQEYKLL